MRAVLIFIFITLAISSNGQDYFLEDKGPFDISVPSPEAYLGYPIGFQHTRHDKIVDYLQELARTSENAQYIEYGRTHEGRVLGMLVVGNKANLSNLESIRKMHLQRNDPTVAKDNNTPIIINLGYNVHGNEPSGAEAALLTAYTMTASTHPDIDSWRNNAILFIDPVINPDGRDRHSQWVNAFKGKNLIKDPLDIEHNEGWPRGRTNHYWFDLNRDWWLAIHPESRGKLNWYHTWYPNVVTDFHEMGTNSTFFFEPMKDNGSENPIMPKENYNELNDLFAEYFSQAMDQIGSLYFTKEVFDGTYPGYGSSYPDLQGGLGILFEQASSRGHAQETPTGEITFQFTIKNQLTSSFATIQAAVENKETLFDYQKDFFASALTNAKNDKVKAYVFNEENDKTRLNAFLDKLLIHRIEFYKDSKSSMYVVPTDQPQYRMVQSVFETYDEFQDSVFYDASAWSLANYYNIEYSGVTSLPSLGDMVTSVSVSKIKTTPNATLAYLIPWTDYNAPAVMYQLQDNDVNVQAAFKAFSVMTDDGVKNFTPGTMMIPVKQSKIEDGEIHTLVKEASEKYNVDVYATSTSFSSGGVDLGSRYIDVMEKPKIITFVGNSISGYEAGELWHLMDQRINMPITKVQLHNFNRVNLNDYNTMVLVSGAYSSLDSSDIMSIKNWVKKGNTLITTRGASAWAIKNKIVAEALVTNKKKKEDKAKAEKLNRKPWIDSREIEGKKGVGGAFFEVDVDLTHPVAFGFTDKTLPVYRNSTTWLAPSKNPYANVAMYTEDPHIDGFITDDNLNNYLKKSASIIVSKVGGGRTILFAENPNFRGTMYGTNKLLLNAIFFGKEITVPNVR